MLWGEIYTSKKRMVCSPNRRLIFRYACFYRRFHPEIETIIVPEADWYYLVAPDKAVKEYTEEFNR